jgi:4-hydroxy-3-methylbut-2-enyl diphosphate reductase
MVHVEIDPHAGFCFGVTRVVSKAEEIIRQYGSLYCLGDLVHNQKEIERLERMGLVTISRDAFHKLANCRVLIRAHGEPPETYQYAAKNNIELIDGTCPIVLKLQGRIRKDYSENAQAGAQLVIFGKKDHAEVRGLAGQTGYRTIIAESEDDLAAIDFTRPVHLYAQTTMSRDQYNSLLEKIREKSKDAGMAHDSVTCNNSICGQVSGREPRLKQFCSTHDVVLFVSYEKSSNGKLLYAQCKSVNDNTHFVSGIKDVDVAWFKNTRHIGITGATSTPGWLLEEIAVHVTRMTDGTL